MISSKSTSGSQVDGYSPKFLFGFKYEIVVFSSPSRSKFASSGVYAIHIRRRVLFLQEVMDLIKQHPR